MPDRTQDLTNHRKVAVACKNYTDTQIAQAKEEIYWHIGEYSVTTSDDNTSASVKTVPSNATRCKIKRVYGNTQKFNPTTASDSTSAMMKTMPSTVYDFDVSKVEGNSEKSENLYNPATNTTGKAINSSGTIIDNNNSYYSDYIAVNSSTAYYLAITNLASNSDFRVHYYDSSKTWLSTSLSANSTFTTPNNCSYVRLSVYNEADRVSNIMLNSGSTALPYSPYYDGIHNFAWTGVKVEGANRINDGIVSSSGSANYTYGYATLKANTQYTITFNVLSGGATACNLSADGYGSIIGSGQTQTQILTNGSVTFTVSQDLDNVRLYGFINGSAEARFMINEGSTALPYVPYITPTTIPIDLSTILYNGTPLFEGNSLKAVNDVKDSVTPYKATKKVGSRAYQSGDEEDTSVLTDGTTTLYELATPIEVSINWASTLRGITGYSNGTITLLNTYNMDSANTITYNSIIKENCCAKMVQSRGGSAIKTINFPTQASDGYSAGSVANVRDFTTNKRIGNVSKENDLGSFNWFYGTIAGGQNYGFRVVVPDLKVIFTSSQLPNLKCAKYNTITPDQSYVGIQGLSSYITINYIVISDSNYTDATIFKTAMANEPLYYELADASKTSTDITPLEENVIEVQAGDELAFYDSNDNLVTIPTDLTYRIEVER